MDWNISGSKIEVKNGSGILMEVPKGQSASITDVEMKIEADGYEGEVFGIKVTGAPNTSQQVDQIDIEAVLQKIECLLDELSDYNRKLVQGQITSIRQATDSNDINSGLKIIYDVAVGTTGSLIATLLQSLAS